MISKVVFIFDKTLIYEGRKVYAIWNSFPLLFPCLVDYVSKLKNKKRKKTFWNFFLHKLVDPSQNKKLHLSDQKHLKTNSMNYYSTCLHILLDKLFHNKFHLLCFKTWCGINHRRLNIEDRRKNRTTLA